MKLICVFVKQNIFCKVLEFFFFENGEGLLFCIGDEFEFVEDFNNGWWLVKIKGGKEGWVLVFYLERVNIKLVVFKRLVKLNFLKKV